MKDKDLALMIGGGIAFLFLPSLLSARKIPDLPPTSTGSGRKAQGGEYGPEVDLSKMRSADSWENEPVQVLQKIRREYGRQIAIWVEKIYIIETTGARYTRPFTSGQYRATWGAGGGQPVSSVYPWGWTSGLGIWDNNPDLKPLGIWYYNTSVGDIQIGNDTSFLVYPSMYAAAKHLGAYLQKYNDPLRWNAGSNAARRATYQRLLDQAQNTIIQ